jgi:dimethylsulfide dehydrogenase subunit beta/complex iron-sulfur molybdoenzyme family reductase subunit beta
MADRQYAMVMDLNKCLGCHTCSISCKKQWTDHDGMGYMYWNNVETRPGAGYPRNFDSLKPAAGGFNRHGMLTPSILPTAEDYGKAWEFNYEDRLFRGGGKSVQPDDRKLNWGPNWDEDQGLSDRGQPYFFYLPRICNHCTNPACVAACTRKAIYKRKEDGIVLVDQKRCRGYRHCIQACPYKKIYFNEVAGVSQKCIFCYPRLEKGKPNACAAQCPGRLRFVGLLDDPQSPVHKLVRQWRVALGLFPERGTGPNVYYIPPFNPPRTGNYGKSILDDPRLPVKYLEYLFGPRVIEVIGRLETELKCVQGRGKSEILDLLIGRDADTRYRIVKAGSRDFDPWENTPTHQLAQDSEPAKGTT